MTRTLEASPLAASIVAELGEGPQWDSERGRLSWVDIVAGRIHVGAADGSLLRTFELDRPVGAALPAAGGGFLVADARGFTKLDEDGTAFELLPVLADDPRVRFNDGKCDALGRAWAGTMAYDQTPGLGVLYRLDPGPVATPVLSGLTVSNGLGWSPDGRTMWFADSAMPQLAAFAYDLDDGLMGRRTAVIELQQDRAVPDGLCVDDDGCVWVALWGAGAVHRYTPDGRLDTIVSVAAEQVTSCAFGGGGLATLFITTARSGLAPEEAERQPLAGSVFAVEPGVTGPAAVPWRPVG